MIPARALIPGLLRHVLQRAPLSDDKVAFAWHTVVGAAVSRVTSVALAGDTLRVRTPDATWQRELQRSAPAILPKLSELLGPGVVARLDIFAP